MDCANGVGAIALTQLINCLHTDADAADDADVITLDICNDGSHGELNHLVITYIHAPV